MKALKNLVERRLWNRLELRLPARLVAPGGESISAVALDLSQNGVNLAVGAPRVGETPLVRFLEREEMHHLVEIHLFPCPEETWRLKGLVMWFNHDHRLPEMPYSLGIEFCEPAPLPPNWRRLCRRY